MKMRVSDAAGRTVRELSIPDSRNQAGIHTICWDMRGEPITAPADSVTAAGARGGRGGAGAGGGAGGGRGATPAVPGVPQPVPTPINGQNPCNDNGPAPARGGGGAPAGGLGGPGAYVMPGVYTVALTSNGKSLDTKQLKVVFDPDVKFVAGEHEKYNTVVTDLGTLQVRAVKVASALNTLHPQMADVAKKVADNANVPAAVKAQFDAFNKQYEAARKKFGVPLPVPAAGGRGGGGGRGGAAADPENVLARATNLRNQIAGIWETPSASLTRQAGDVKLDLPKAITEGNAVLTRAEAMSQALKKYDITLNAPSPIK